MHFCRQVSRLWIVSLIAMSGIASSWHSQAAGSAPNPPATVTEAAQVLDLATFPLVDGAEAPRQRNVANLSYRAPGTVEQVFQFHQKQLAQRQWKELPNAYVTGQMANATFGCQGYLLSLAVFPSGQAGAVDVTLTNHGNVALDKLPVPPGAKPFYGGPVSTAYLTEAPVAETAEACRQLLTASGWQPYGVAGDALGFKQNAVQLTARVAAAPAQGGKTVIDYSAVLMSADLPAPPETEQLQYADVTTQLSFDFKGAQADVFDFYRQALSKMAWVPTTERPLRIGFKDVLLFRNPQKDLLTLEVHSVDGKSRVALRHQTAAAVAEQEQRARAEIERRQKDQEKPLPKVSVTLPAGASELRQTKNRIEFKVPAGKAKVAVEAWRRQFVQDGWKEDVAALANEAGSLSFSKDAQSVSVLYVETGFLPSEVTLQATGVDLEGVAEKGL